MNKSVCAAISLRLTLSVMLYKGDDCCCWMFLRICAGTSCLLEQVRMITSRSEDVGAAHLLYTGFSRESPGARGARAAGRSNGNGKSKSNSPRSINDSWIFNANTAVCSLVDLCSIAVSVRSHLEYCASARPLGLSARCDLSDTPVEKRAISCRRGDCSFLKQPSSFYGKDPGSPPSTTLHTQSSCCRAGLS